MTARWPLVLNNGTIQELQSGDTLNGLPTTFESGTTMTFVQSTAPTGWTKSTAHNDKALRVVSGTAGTGGSLSFSSTFTTGNTGAFTLSTSEMPSHSHYMGNGGNSTGDPGHPCYTRDSGWSGTNTTAAGGGGSHSHSLNLAVAYVDVIIATKD